MEISLEDICNGSKIIDIRDFVSYNNGHIDGAININYNDLIINPNRYLNMSDVYYIYCQKGVKSLECVMVLRGLGYKVYSIIGGYDSLQHS